MESNNYSVFADIDRCTESAIIELDKAIESASISISQFQQKAAKKKAKKIGIISLTALLLITILTVVYIKVLSPSLKYNSALKLFDEGKYREAYQEFSKLEYKDSQSRLESIWLEHPESFNIGDVIVFGNYNGEKHWRILDKKDGKVLVLSENCLDYIPWSKDSSKYTSEENLLIKTWEGCSLRSWLNNDFYNAAFSDDEKKLISSTSLSNADSGNPTPKYSYEEPTVGGNDTQDMVFVLSASEAKTYFKSDKDRAGKDSYGEPETWWLRTVGSTQEYAQFVADDGSLYETGTYMSTDRIAVRPAVWINVQ